MIRTFHYTGSIPMDLERGEAKLSLLPGRLYSFDDATESDKIKLIVESIPKEALSERTVVPPPPKPKKVKSYSAPVESVPEPTVTSRSERRRGRDRSESQ